MGHLSSERVNLKIGRAQKHLDEIMSQELRLRQSPDCRVVREKNLNENFVDFVLRLPTPDPCLSVIVGDCVHNARSTLDHLIYALAEFVNGSRTEENRRRSMFPICLSENGDF